MAALPYMQLYVADYLADTAHLTTVEHGAYLLLIFNYWQRGDSFKAKDEHTLNRRLASVARLSNEEWQHVKEVLSEFFNVSETEWVHERIERDLDAVNSKSDKARKAGKASADARSKANQQEKIEGNERSTCVKQTLNHTDTDTDTDKKNTKSITQLALLKSRNIPEEIARDWLRIRKEKRQPLTETALKATEREAAAAGLTLMQAITVACENSWAGFKAEYYANLKKPKQEKSNGLPWYANEQSIQAKGRELGLTPRGGESWNDFKGRISEKIAQMEAMN